MNTYNPETHVAVPKTELVKLEESREGLFDYLKREGFFGVDGSVEHYMKVHSIVHFTSQLWKVANKFKWEN